MELASEHRIGDALARLDQQVPDVPEAHRVSEQGVALGGLVLLGPPFLVRPIGAQGAQASSATPAMARGQRLGDGELGGSQAKVGAAGHR